MYDLLLVLFGFALVLMFLAFMGIGFITSLGWMIGGFSNNDKSDSSSDNQSAAPVVSAKPSLETDVIGSRRLIDHLLTTGQIKDEQYQFFRGLLEKKFARVFKSDQGKFGEPKVEQSGSNKNESKAAPITEFGHTPTVDAANDRPVAAPKDAEPQSLVYVPVDSSEDEIVSAETVSKNIVNSAADSAPSDEPSLAARVVKAERAQNAPATIAPWDRPDPLPRPPHRSFAEVMSGFMQEKNMRWGELTSGILIVLSAVGLVVSLRDQLSDAVPYFSSILFMLITSAIIGAGIYTLKKWKLRNTSRGTLIIGLLLIPLNFVAACVLSGGEERRLLTDPWLWIALVVGFGGFGTMAGYASKFLLRKQHWQLVIATIGCGAATILINRVLGSIDSGVANIEVDSLDIATQSPSSFNVFLLSLPVVVTFLVGAGAFTKRFWVKQYWSPRSTNRLFLNLGISTFAVAAALSLFLIRSDLTLLTSVAITPVLVVVGLIGSWIGAMVRNSSHRSLIQQDSSAAIVSVSTNPLLVSDTTDASSNAMVGLSLQVLGMVLVTIFLLVSASNPIVFAINCVIVAAGFLLIAMNQRTYELLAVAWAVLAAGVLTGMNLSIGRFAIDQWTSLTQIQDALISGESGLCLLACGVTAAGLQSVVAHRFENPRELSRLKRIGLMTGSGIVMVGTIIALLASLINREDVFDTMTASVLLLIAGSGAYVATLVKNWVEPDESDSLTDTAITRDRQSSSELLLPNLAAIVVLVGLAHTLLWNPVVASWLDNLLMNVNANWVAMFTIHGMLFAIAAAYKRLGADQEVVHYWSFATLLLATLGAFYLGPFQTCIATGVMLVLVAGWWMVSSTIVRGGSKSPASIQFAGVPFVMATGGLVIIAIAEVLSQSEFCPALFTPGHWMAQVVGLACWVIFWTLTASIIKRTDKGDAKQDIKQGAKSALGVSQLVGAEEEVAEEEKVSSVRWSWLVSAYPRVDQVVAHLLVVIVGAVIAVSLFGGTAIELFKNVDVSNFSLVDDPKWVFAALAAVIVSMLLLTIEQPTVFKGAALVVLWILVWSSGAIPFESSKSMASAIRWLVPIGGLIAAILMSVRHRFVPVWVLARNRLGLSGRSVWKKPVTQELINLGLALICGAVLVVSTFTVAQVMLNGAASLGGPETESWFGAMDKVVSFGIPLGLVVTTLLVFAISERRSWLATAGSAVFQYMVLLAIVLLFLSPHPKMASAWFVRILQSVSIGMTAYGSVWYLTRNRIDSRQIATANGTSNVASGWQTGLRQIDFHTLVNGLLIFSLAVVVYVRFYVSPNLPGGWINSIGSPLGIVAAILYAGFTLVVWRSGLVQHGSVTHWSWLGGSSGMVVVAMLAAFVGYFFSGDGAIDSWDAFNVLCCGTILLAACQVAWLTWSTSWSTWAAAPQVSFSSQATLQSEARLSAAAQAPWNVHWSFIATLGIGLAFAIQGSLSNVTPTSFWFYFGLVVATVGIVFVCSLAHRRVALNFLAAGLALIASTLLVNRSGIAFANDQPNWINISFLIVITLALATLGFYLVRQKHNPESFNRWFVGLPNLMILFGSVWVFAASIGQVICDSGWGGSTLGNWLGFGVVSMMLALLLASIWNDCRRFWTLGLCLLSMGCVITGLSMLTAVMGLDDEPMAIAIISGVAVMAMLWGMGWSQRSRMLGQAKRLGVPKVANLERSLSNQLPIYSLVFAGFIILFAFMAIFNSDARPLRYVTAGLPFVLAIGVGCLANQGSRRMYQLISLGLVTVGCVLVAWADMQPIEMVRPSVLPILIRSLLVLAGLMFVYGNFVTRWVREGDSWLKSLRQMAAFTCGLAILCLCFVLMAEISQFDSIVGCGLSLAESGSVAAVIVGMVVGLVTIAVVPKHDPFSVSLLGRQSYIYVAQIVCAGLVLHVYLTMPWMFQYGVKEYWPYIMMAICFGGVGLAHVLQKRELPVLGQPLFTTASILPAVTAAGVLAVDSKADAALVMLSVGLAYLLISYIQKSMWSGIAAIAFGNLALWLFYGADYINVSFFDRPQLWLIPPAVSVLIASQVYRKSLSTSQLALLRYVCVAVIYVSSTSEIFIQGLGGSLLPPMILAFLSVVGIMCGILLQIRSFLYLGSLFLLMAMITMVAHAHQRFDHVWPWWAFGITLGIGILVMFGLFEKKKNEMKAIAGRMKEWET